MKSRKWSLLLLAGLPLVALHLGLLIERALHWETIDSVVVLRWTLAVALLGLLKRVMPRFDQLRSPSLAIAAILIFGLIHLPIAAPEPSLPLAATGFGLALSLAVVERRCGSLAVSHQMAFLARPGYPERSLVVSRDALKDRAPPSAR
ncbi:MAG: hypothetical protein ABI672_21450 [Vicinamibacteria bacterium]